MTELSFFRRSLIACLFLCITAISVSSCKKEDKDPPEDKDLSPIASVVLNGVYTSFSRGYFYVSDAGGVWRNFITLYKTDNSEIRITFTEFGEGVREIASGDTSLTIRYKDSGQRVFTADSGLVNITDYKIRDGVILITGGFAFRAKSAPIILPDNTSYNIIIDGVDGAFLNLQSSDE